MGFRCWACALSASISLRASHSEATPESLAGGGAFCARTDATERQASEINANFMVTFPDRLLKKHGRVLSTLCGSKKLFQRPAKASLAQFYRLAERAVQKFGGRTRPVYGGGAVVGGGVGLPSPLPPSGPPGILPTPT